MKKPMDLRSGEIKLLYFKYLASAFGSALISCIYGVVDMAMVGQYEGPGGTAALAVVAPVWNIIYSPGLLTGIGGSVIFSTKKSTAGSGDDQNAYFTAAVVGSVLFAAASRGGLLLFEKPILRFLGEDSSLLSLVITYMKPILYVLPVFSQSGACHYSYLRRLVFAAAVQYFLRLLFSVDLKTEGGIYHFRRARAFRPRGFHPALPLCFGCSSVWLPMPRTELVTALCAAALMQKYTAAG